ncbi:MAG: aminotransferase class I/II-fold pyridoxal phosphate-dependent enzyme [Fibrobacteres bacterium]|nr:aminotransferase class I/II-fold pyridoxal phosphate-dependent enzyme [Fibrobacterota bacterium]
MPHWMENSQSEIEKSGLLRKLRLLSSDVIDMSSNDYLGLRRHPEMVQAASEATQRFGTSSGSSRLISGNSDLYMQLESSLRNFKKVPSVLVASSGYALNVSLIPTLIKEGDAVIIDRLVHASLVDGAKLSGARLFVYEHADMNCLEKVLKRSERYRRRLIVTDSVFSMDGDIAPLNEIVYLAEKYSAETLIDEAHATGVIGPMGAGVVAELNLTDKVDYTTSTFSKALGSLGGFVASRHASAESYLLNSVRGVVFSTALPPSVIAASIKGVELAQGAVDKREYLLQLAKIVDKNAVSAIIPIVVGDEKKCVEISEILLAKGMFVPAVRFPTVARGASRLRVSVNANHSTDNVQLLIAEIRKIGL